LAEAKTTAEGPHVRVSLVRGENADGKMALAFEFRLDPDWHVYWRNPGDSGAAPKFDLIVRNGLASPIQWPAPERIRLGDLTNYGYTSRILYPFSVEPQDSLKPVLLEASLEWLVCKVECLPGFGKITAVLTPNLPPGAKPQPLSTADYPLPSSPSAQLKVFSQDETSLGILLEGSEQDLNKIREIDLFPLEGEIFSTQSPSFQLVEGKWRAKLQKAANAPNPIPLFQVLMKMRDDSGWKASEHQLDPSSAKIAWKDLGTALLFAFFGGIILNLMPCVFPVLSIKILSLVQKSEKPQEMHKSGWLYSAGVVTTFLFLSALLLVLRSGGEKLGWGFQLQSPAFVIAMALLFFMIGLNFLGALEMGDSASRLGGTLGDLPLFHSSFGTGIIATLVATPCTAPFMGSALGASLFLPWWGSLLVFSCLGAGMAAPFLMLSYFPSLLSRLPKPGLWMERLKQFLAFPLFATTVWLGWVLVQQAGEHGFLLLGFSLVLIGFGTWLKQWRWLVILLTFVTAISLSPSTARKERAESSQWASLDLKKISEAKTNGTPVFIDFTAAWCLTCQWNKKSVLETKAVMDVFEKNKVLLIRADWTHRDPLVTQTLAKYGRNSVPLYVFIPARGEDIILPELITKSDIDRLFQ
jgi:thiol:disulfide interchange protein